MSTALTSIAFRLVLSPAGRVVCLIAAALAVILYFRWTGKKEGRNEVISEIIAKSTAAQNRMAKALARSPRDRDTLLERLRNGSG